MPRHALQAGIEVPWHDPDHEVRRVGLDGSIKWHGEHVFFQEALAREPVGTAAHERRGHIVKLMTRDLGLIDAANRVRRGAQPRKQRSKPLVRRPRRRPSPHASLHRRRAMISQRPTVRCREVRSMRCSAKKMGAPQQRYDAPRTHMPTDDPYHRTSGPVPVRLRPRRRVPWVKRLSQASMIAIQLADSRTCGSPARQS